MCAVPAALRGRAVVPKRRNDSAKGLCAIPADFAPHASAALEYNGSCNKFAAVPDELLASTTLESLDLSANRLRALPPLRTSDGAWACFTALTTLRLSLNRLGRVPPELFALPRLQELVLRRCGLTELVFPADLAPEQSRLRLLDVEHNELERLPPVACFPRL